ncbi:hypothetical protein [Neptunitalea lumnitzerae]|uniref:Uncharacterized protein n=1 Tax=Neptunitalea lumnitzerae TaxID=2965509 RepID=A0ABQ5MNC2_9FLAO|nr:hypothetical protein [Neptunitalea sp. Y10]GLB50901.1 hypothetical protein Y10_32690 [Neptunitalea sp. Y10]
METNFIKNIDDNNNNNSKKRETLYLFQNIIVTGLLAFTAIAFFFYNSLEVEKGIKIIFAPFLSIVPLLFVLSILKDLKKGFKNADYNRDEIIKFSMVAAGVAALFVGVTYLFSKIDALEILLASLMAVLSIVFFLKSKIKDVLGMAIITGIAEGIIVYMVFLF